MHAVSKPEFRAVDFTLSVIFAGMWIYLSAGFFHVDPHTGKTILALSWMARIATPLMGAGLLYLYYRIRTGRSSVSSAAVLLGTLILMALIGYPVISHIYYSRHSIEQRNQYHPYLQLAPRKFQSEQHNSTEEPYRIFCLGGSTTEFTDSRGVGWPARVGNQLSAGISGRPVNVYNLGRQWYTTQHTLYNYITNLRFHRPDVIVVMHAINDLMHNADFSYYSAGKFQDDYRHFHGPVYRLIRRPTFPAYVVQVLGEIWYHQSREIVTTDLFPGLRSFERNLRTLIEVAQIDSVPVVLLTQPYLYKDSMTAEEQSALVMIGEAVGPDKEWDIQTARRGMEQYNDVIRRLAREKGLVLVDLEKEIPKSLEFLFDDVHYQRVAFDKIGELVANRLLASDILGDVHRTGDVLSSGGHVSGIRKDDIIQ